MGMGVGEFWMLTQDEIREVGWGRALPEVRVHVPTCARLGECALPSGNMGEPGSCPSIIDIHCLGRDGPARWEAHKTPQKSTLTSIRRLEYIDIIIIRKWCMQMNLSHLHLYS